MHLARAAPCQGLPTARTTPRKLKVRNAHAKTVISFDSEKRARARDRRCGGFMAGIFGDDPDDVQAGACMAGVTPHGLFPSTPRAHGPWPRIVINLVSSLSHLLMLYMWQQQQQRTWRQRAYIFCAVLDGGYGRSARKTYLPPCCAGNGWRRWQHLIGLEKEMGTDRRIPRAGFTDCDVWLRGNVMSMCSVHFDPGGGVIGYPGS